MSQKQQKGQESDVGYTVVLPNNERKTYESRVAACRQLELDFRSYPVDWLGSPHVGGVGSL